MEEEDEQMQEEDVEPEGDEPQGDEPEGNKPEGDEHEEIEGWVETNPKPPSSDTTHEQGKTKPRSNHDDDCGSGQPSWTMNSPSLSMTSGWTLTA